MMETPSSMARPVTIGICTSALRSNIKAFIAKVSSLTDVTVRFIELPYNDLDSFSLSSAGLDGVIICHSINNRRFAITDVMDALYDKFLPHVRKIFGKDNVCVIAHDFPWPMGSVGSSSDHARVKDTYMNSFQSKQFTAFDCSKLTMICGRLDKQVDVDEEDWKQLQHFLLQCRVKQAAKEILGYYILLFVCLPVMILLTTVDFILLWKRPNGANCCLCISFKNDVIKLTLKGSEDYQGLWWNLSWISYFIPFQLTRNSYWFALSLVKRRRWSVFDPVEDDSPLSAAQRPQAAKEILGYYILLFVCLPVIIPLTAVDFILLWMRPNGANWYLCILFKEDVINLTLKGSEDYQGVWWNLFWISFFIPSQLARNSCWFAFSLVKGCRSTVCMEISRV